MKRYSEYCTGHPLLGGVSCHGDLDIAREAGYGRRPPWGNRMRGARPNMARHDEYFPRGVPAAGYMYWGEYRTGGEGANAAMYDRIYQQRPSTHAQAD